MKIFADSEEKFVANYMLFAATGKLFTFTDAAMTKKATKDQVVEMFKKGVVVSYNNELYYPVECDPTGTTAKLALATVNGTTVTVVNIASDVNPA